MFSNRLLTDFDMARLVEYVNSGNAEAYYDYLAGKGYDYGRLAGGVVRNDTLNGRVANDYAQAVADDAGIPMSEDDWARVRQRLMEEDLEARQSKYEKGEQDTTLSYDDISRYHRSVFEEFNLPRETWTADIPGQLAGPEEAERMWEEMLDADDSIFSQLLNGTGTLWDAVTNFPTGELVDAALGPETFPENIDDPNAEAAAEWLGFVIPSAFSGFYEEAGENFNEAVDHSQRSMANYVGIFRNYLFGAQDLISPLVLDLDGDGLELTSLIGSAAFFDLDADVSTPE